MLDRLPELERLLGYGFNAATRSTAVRAMVEMEPGVAVHAKGVAEMQLAEEFVPTGRKDLEALIARAETQ